MGGRAKVAVAEAQSLMAMDVTAALALLKDEDKMASFFEKLAALKSEIDKDLETLGTADEIDRLLLKTRDNHKMSEEELAKVKAEAAATNDKADGRLTEAKKALEDAGADANKLLMDAGTAAKKQTSEAEIAKKAAVTDRQKAAEEKTAAATDRAAAKVLLAKMQDKLATAQELVATLTT